MISLKNLFAALLVAGAVVVAPFAAQAEPTKAELVDGTVIAIDGDAVSVVNADGSMTPAPDGEHELKDGTKVTTKDGKIVK